MAQGQRLGHIVNADGTDGTTNPTPGGQKIARIEVIRGLSVDLGYEIAPKKALLGAKLVVDPHGNLKIFLMQRVSGFDRSTGVGRLR